MAQYNPINWSSFIIIPIYHMFRCLSFFQAFQHLIRVTYTNVVRHPIFKKRIILFLVAFMLVLTNPYDAQVVSLEFNIDTPIPLSDAVDLLFTGGKSGDWQQFGASVTATADGYYPGLQGSVEAIEFKAGLGLKWSFGNNVLQDIVRDYLGMSFNIHFDLSASAP